MDVTSGLILGIAYVAAPGPINVETLRQGVKGGLVASLAVQTGSSIGLILYALLALFGAGILLQGATWQVAGAGDDIISVPPGTYLLSLTGAGEDAAQTGDLDLLANVTINGAGQGQTIIDGNGADRVFNVWNNVTVHISGGATLTHALLENSPAIDAGNPGGCRDQDGNLLTTDQRGSARPAGGSSLCDIGAYEAGDPGPPTPTPTATVSPTPDPAQKFIYLPVIVR